MHPKIHRDAQGSCSKCGMPLRQTAPASGENDLEQASEIALDRGAGDKSLIGVGDQQRAMSSSSTAVDPDRAHFVKYFFPR